MSSLVPIQIALSKNLNDSLNANRSKTKGSIVTISTDAQRQEFTSYILFGSIGVIAGIAIYYLLPLAVLNFNIGLILEIFFFILLGMILGLTLVALNLQRMAELILVYIFLFFERQSMKMMILKNLIAHRESNKLTAIIFSLTLGSIIFVVVAANLQIQTLTGTTSWGKIQLGVDSNAVSTDNTTLMSAPIIDPVLRQFSSNIKSFGYRS